MLSNFEEARIFINENDIKMIDFRMIDLNGRWHHLTIPADRFTESTMTAGIGFDGSNYGFAPVEKSDMVFIPDLSSAAIDDFCEIKTLSMIGDVRIIGEKENIPFNQEPRNVSKRAEEYMKELGVADQFLLGPEFEFYVFDEVTYANKPNSSGFTVDGEEAFWNTGEIGSLGFQTPHQGGYHIAPPQDINYDYRSRVTMLMEQQGIKVKYHHHEVGGPGQMEIEVEFGGMTEMADKTMLTKYIVKNEAVKEGKTATFMPKPIYGEAGSGMHVHMLMFKDGKPIFYDEDGYSGLSQTALYFIGGILRHVPAICAFSNPSTNSYKRLLPGFEAPVTIGYATANRSAVIRIPAYAKTPETKRFELRNPDATCNPYYCYAAILMAGLDGIKNKIDPEAEGYGPYDFNLFNLSDEEKKKIKGLPKSLGSALKALEKDHDFLTAGGVFPIELINIWIANRRKDLGRHISMPTPMEYEMYYDL
ncbi:MAG: type I glutamate--ammonia ligase [Saccharofermentans sp.]|nr:type I glutamate--ammonia ligase [Saccharofermentans sp.]